MSAAALGVVVGCWVGCAGADAGEADVVFATGIVTPASVFAATSACGGSQMVFIPSYTSPKMQFAHSGCRLTMSVGKALETR